MIPARPLSAALLLLLASCKPDAGAGATPTKEPAPPADRPAPAGAPTKGEHEGFSVVDAKGAPSELPALLATEAGRAKSKSQKPFVYVWASWCGPCQKLKASLDDPRMVDAFRGTYIIKVDLDEEKDGLDAAGIKAGAIPLFVEIDERGKPTGRRIDGGAWGEDVPENMAPPLKKFFAG